MKLFSKNEIRNNNSETNLMIQKNEKVIKIVDNNNNLKVTLIISLIILFIILKIYIRNKYNEDENINPDYHDIYFEEKFDSYIDAFNKSKDFINNNINGILLNITKIQLTKKLNVSIVIPCLNCKKYILSFFRLIQNQDFSNFEIIIVNDASTDDTLLYIEELQKEDQRITILSHKANYGLLYTRSIGTLSSKGKYIL